jgi:methionyl-tRNA synthetase
VPAWGQKVQRFLRMPEPLTFASAGEPLPAGHAIGEYETLAEPIDPKHVAAIVEASKETIGVAEAAPAAAYAVPDLAASATIDRFAPLDLRVAKVLQCENVEGSTKLLRLTLDLGPLGTRNVFSGIAQSYRPEELVGKNVVVFANLEPRKMRFGVSEGMVLSAGIEGDDASATVLELDPRALPGLKIS